VNFDFRAPRILQSRASLSENVALHSLGAEYDRRAYGERKPSVFLASQRDYTPPDEAYTKRMGFLLPKPSIRLSVTSDACGATAVGTSPERRAWIAAAAGAWFCIQQEKLAELQQQHIAGNLSTPPGDNVGLRLLGR
jgi:hypothetical protein